MNQFTGVLGIFVLLAIAYILSNNKRIINMRIVGWGLGLQLLLALIILKTPMGPPFFEFFDKAIKKLISFSDRNWSVRLAFVAEVGQ